MVYVKVDDNCFECKEWYLLKIYSSETENNRNGVDFYFGGKTHRNHMCMEKDN